MEMVVVVAGVSSRSRAARAEDAVKKAVGGRLRVKKKAAMLARTALCACRGLSQRCEEE